MMGAILPARHYYMYRAGYGRSFLFSAPGIPENLIIRWPEEPEGKVRPSYNVLRMLKALNGQLVPASSTGLDAVTGEGVGALAAADAAGERFNVLIWNFRRQLAAPPVAIRARAPEYPDFLAGRRLRFRRYLVGPQHSNWKFNPDRDHLEMVEDFVVDGGAPFQFQYQNVPPNSVMLLTFCPNDPSPCPALASPPFPIGPVIRNLFVDRMAHDAADVSWDTPSGSATRRLRHYVQYRPLGDSTWRASAAVEDTGTRHAVTVSGLTPVQTYQMRAVSVDPTPPGCEAAMNCPQGVSEEWLTFTTAARPGQIIYAFSPTDDTVVHFTEDVEECRTVSFHRLGVLPLLHTSQQVFLRFDIQGLSGPVESAALRLFAYESGWHGGALYWVPDSGWREAEVNCLNYPQMDPNLIYYVPSFVQTGLSYDFYIPRAFIGGNGPVSFGLRQPMPYALTAYASRENGTSRPRGFYPPPILYVTINR